MRTSLNVGVWIDHRKAVVVHISGDRASMEVIRSHVGPRVRMHGGARSKTIYGPQDVAAESSRDERYRQHLARYYDRVLAAFGQADRIYVFGPGEAKQELERRLLAAPVRGERVVALEAADKLTDAEIVAQVRRHFGLGPHALAGA